MSRPASTDYFLFVGFACGHDKTDTDGLIVVPRGSGAHASIAGLETPALPTFADTADGPVVSLSGSADSDGEEGGTAGFHLGPFFNSVGVGAERGIAASARNETDTFGASPDVRHNDEAVVASDRGEAVLGVAALDGVANHEVNLVIREDIPRILVLVVVDGSAPVDEVGVAHVAGEAEVGGRCAIVELVAETSVGMVVVVSILVVGKTPVASLVVEKEVTLGKVDLLGVGNGDETVDERIGSKVGGNVEGEVMAALDGDGSTGGSGLHALGK